MGFGYSENECLYRIMPFTQFLYMLVNKKNSLLHPDCWDDPFESQMTNYQVRTIINGKESYADFNAHRWYAQCWSYSKESDGLWRSFTQDRKIRSVKIQSTIGRLLNSWKPTKTNKTEMFLCSVNYSQELEYLQNQLSLSKEYQIYLYKGMEPDSPPEEIQFINELALLTLKRDAFSYEKECRLLAYRPRCYKTSSWGYVTDINTLSPSIEFDPWTKDFEKEDLINILRKMGYKGNITFSSLYNKRYDKTTLTLRPME